MTDDLRALAEQIIAGTHIHPSVEQGKALLGLLDERDGYKRMLDDLIQQQLARERRVAALEEGLQAYADHHEAEAYSSMPDCAALDKQARALLADSPTASVEPVGERSDPLAVKDGLALFKCPECGSLFDAPILQLGQQVAVSSHLPHDLQERADAIAQPESEAGDE